MKTKHLNQETTILPAAEVTHLVRRRPYLVPVAILKPVCERPKGDWLASFDVVPILGPPHADAELGVKDRHYHIDWRFMPPAFRRSVNEHRAGQEKGVVVWAQDVQEVSQQAMTYRLPAVQWPAFDHRVRPLLEDLYAAAQLKPGLICPHKGADLSHCPADENGVVECPLHGLRWNVHTGSLVPSPT
jgi:hypothetical protein